MNLIDTESLIVQFDTRLLYQSYMKKMIWPLITNIFIYET